MGQASGIGQREREILTAIVQTYISTGEPVGSRTLARSNRENLSPASIRNVMSDLADAGFLEQPHTSSGRVPTAQAYRFYANQLTGEARLSPADEGLIQGTLQGLIDVQEFMERTSHVLSLISHGVGVTVSSVPGQGHALEHVYFQRLGDKKVLAVVVMRNGIVRDRVLRLTDDLTVSDLEVAANYINQNFRGWEMDAVRNEIARRLQQERAEYDRLMRSVEELYAQGALATEAATQTVFVEGAANLVISEQDKERLRQLLATLEEKQRIVDLLSAYLDARQEAVRVVVGLEEAVPHLNNFVLIGAPARVGNEVIGSLAVIGPTRMDYEHTITAVSYIARLFDKFWNETT
ncbi:MAG TPA: heat-inducible transcriptional repressor HrcA [Candidatus Eisenbacteria bacterium]|nr:heat-inducible transcriptional repressor HrcA [Candidatus Eisenbacteria bacterium]